MRNDDDYSLYPEPPQSIFSSTPMDLGISPNPYAYSRAQECYPTTVAFESAMYADVPFMYQDDSEMPVPSSNLSTASVPSAPSSAMGSPRSNHGQPAPVPEWAGPQALGVSPGIVGQSEFFPAGTEYTAFPGQMDEFPSPFEFAQPKLVGELAQIPRSHQHGSVSSCVSRDSSSTMVPEPILSLEAKASPLSLSPTLSPSCSRKSSLVFVSPSTSSSSFSSPPPPAWSSPTCGAEAMSPTTQPNSARLVSSFFSQSSGHFIAPLDSYPSILHPDVQGMRIPFEHTYPPPPKPAGYPGSPAMTGSPQLRNGSTSPFPTNNYHAYSSPFPVPMDQRRPSNFSGYSADQHYSDGESKEKQRCPHPDCGKTFKDLKAHMLTHQQERPEKCPIQTCDYHVKGFARKYDKNRHTLTHYKGTMVCGFCPGSGSAAEKSFNRADVFKRHLTAVHGVEQTPPNSRKKTATGSANGSKKLTGYAPDATGKCSTCSQTFSNAQDFYEHLDDCVLRIVQQEDPTEAVNAQRLAEVENDKEVHATLEKNQLPTTTQTTSTAEDEDDEDMDDDDLIDEDFKGQIKSLSPTKKSKGNPINGVQKSRGMTHSRGGVPIVGKNKGRKSRQNYPSSWGFDKGQMTMKKRVMTVFDGPRRLAKDDMMLSTEHEVRVKLSDGKAYVTDLDVQTMKRAVGFHNATDEEKGPWISDDPTEDQLQQMAAAQQ